MVKNLPANAGDVRDTSSISGPGRSPGEGNGSLLQYSCLENLMHRGYSPWGPKQSDMTEVSSHICTQRDSAEESGGPPVLMQPCKIKMVLTSLMVTF